MKAVGFLGLGIMGNAMARNLLREGFQVTVWNRTRSRCDPIAELGAAVAPSPAAVVAESPVTIAMVSDPEASQALCFDTGGVLEAMGPGKGYVDMSTVDPTTSRRIAAAVLRRGGRFLEAPVSGSRKPAEEGTLVILAAGERSLYEEVLPIFNVLGKKSLFLGEVGSGAAMKLAVNLVMGEMMVALAEGLAFASKMGVAGEDLLSVLEAGAMASPLIRTKGPAILASDFEPHFPLKHAQKDLRLALALADGAALALPGAAVANECFKRARSLGHGDDDFAAVAGAVGG